ncbi:PLP-dependent aminotransferase family protein [Sphingomonas sp. ID0503]|uniref:aminotransferase-like domain-containing protein n=1 Tax=Sphingomonas sp. ID0503 TaxID=3399691 RepID=UPI003AFB23AC
MSDTLERSRTEEVMQAIRQRIERRMLTPGARLPSVRAMAEASNVSKSTVVEAYDRLVAEGVIRSRPGSGFYVAAPLAPLALADIGPARDRQIDPLWMLRHSLEARADALRPGSGWLPQAWMAEDTIRKGLRHLSRADAGDILVNYGTPHGPEPLRRLIARRISDQGVELGPDQVLMTDSCTNALDLVLRFLIEPGDTVLIDDPCYFNFHAMLRAHRAKPVGVPMTPHGPDIAAFEAALVAHRPRVYITNAAVHNPTGAAITAPIAHRLLKLAEAHDLVIVEDDIFADFEMEPAPRLAAFDGLDRVIRIGSFSKTLSSAVRCGHVAARPDWIAAMADLKIATAMSTNVLSTELLYCALTDGSYRRHVEKVRVRLAAAMRSAIARLKGLGIEPWIEPSAGLFVWCRLPAGLCATEIASAGLAHDILYAPGDVFSLAGTAGDYMRFNVTAMDERVYRHLAAMIGGR